MARPSTIENCPHKDAIVDNLNAGWSPRQVRDYLVERYGPGPHVPSIKAIQRYRNDRIDPTAALPPVLVTGALKRLKGRIDEIGHLDRAIRAQEQRIALFFDREQRTGRSEPQLNDAMRVFTEMLRLRFTLAQQIGVGRAGKEKRVSMTESNTIDLPEESFHEFLALLRRKRDLTARSA